MYNTNQTQQPIYSYQMNRPIYPAMNMMGLKGRPVASIEEARASIIDFDGSIFYFPDLANKRIYTKQINMDGTALLNMYELREIPTEENKLASSNFVTREEFEDAIRSLRQSVAVPQEQPAVSISQPAEPGFALNF